MVLADDHFRSINYGALDRVIAVMAQKGGVGKSSLSANLAGVSAKDGYRVLMIDLDPQANLLDEFGTYSHPGADDGEALTRSILTGAPLKVGIPEVRPNLDLIPGGMWTREISRALEAEKVAHMLTTTDATVEVVDGWRLQVPTVPDEIASSPIYHARLAKVLEPLLAEAEAEERGYDLVVIDAPPNEQAIQRVILGASRYVLIPTAPDMGSIRAIGQIIDYAADTEDGDHIVDVLGAVLIGVGINESRVRRAAEGWMATALGDNIPLFTQSIRTAVAAAQQVRQSGMPLWELAEQMDRQKPWEALREGKKPPRKLSTVGSLASDYFLLVDEVLKRIAAFESAGADDEATENQEEIA